ncbi:MAG TPA: family 78 glycoside hydrolase catalytic domain [bacterium]|nr:family 78 glycoside hydrolase catalytic domain [bacterium]
MNHARIIPILLLCCIPLTPARAENPSWSGSWIWCENEPSATNLYLYCRKTLDVAGEIRSASLNITADSNYILYVNATEIGRGPVRSNPKRQAYDTYDLQGVLKTGANTVCVLVHYIGTSTLSYVSGRGGLLVDGTVALADGSAVRILSDGSWKVRPAEPWTYDMPRMSKELGYGEIFDARQEPSTWNTVGFDDSYWASAMVIGPHPQEPWKELIPRDIPPATGELISPRSILSISNVIAPKQQFHLDFAQPISPNKQAVVYAFTQVYSETQRTLDLVCGSDDGLHVWLNGQSVIEQNVSRRASPNQDRVSVSLNAGWNPLLAKVTQTDGEWRLFLRFDGEGVDALRFSSTEDQGQPVPVWHLIGPFDNKGDIGFATVYPPEISVDLSTMCEGIDGKALSWQRTEVRSETLQPAVSMSRSWLGPLQGSTVAGAETVLGQEGRATLSTLDDSSGISIVLDFGKVVLGYPEIELYQAQEGTQIDLGYSEFLTEDGRVDPYASEVLYADRYTCRSGPQTIRTFDKRGFRYLRLDVYRTGGPLQISSVRVRPGGYPVQVRGAFSSSNERLNKLWQAGVDTLRACMEDVYLDSPWCDRALCMAEARIEMLCNDYTFGDTALARRCLRLIAQSQLPDGRVYGIYPTDSEDALIADSMLIWVMALYDDYFQTGDDSLIREVFPNVVRLLAWFAGHENEDGLLAGDLGRIVIDQAEIDRNGVSAALNAFYYKALCDASAMAQQIGSLDHAQQFTNRAKAVQKVFESRFWDGEAGVFRDSYQDGALSESVSQQTNALAILFGLAPKKVDDPVLAYLSNPENKAIEATPYFSFYWLNALCKANRQGDVLTVMGQRWGKMLDSGSASLWETWDGRLSHCYGASSAPTCIIPAQIVGLRPLSPGWKTAILEPNLGGLNDVSATVPTPKGDISVKLTQRSGGYVMAAELSCPADCAVTVSLPLQGVLKPRVLIDGKKEMPKNVQAIGEKDGRLLYQITGPAHLTLGLQSVPR